MRVLQICSKPPVPAVDGGCKAANNITEGLLKNNVAVKLLTISTHKHPFLPNKLSKEYIENTKVEHVYVDTRVKPLAAISHLCTSKSYNLSRFYCKKFEKLIVNTLANEKFDVVLLEGLFVTSYIQTIRKHSTAKVVLRTHNVEYEIWERNAENEKNALKRMYLRKLAYQLKQHEQDVINKVDAVAAITSKDEQKFIGLGLEKKIEVIPFGIDLKNYVKSNKGVHSDFFHIGSMDWAPNQKAIKWFLKKVWSRIEKLHPEAEFNLAGKRMPEWLLNWNQHHVNIIGEVPSAVEFINEHKIMVAPLFSGSGMRIKVVEGMALGKTIIATEIAMEGIDYENRKNVLIANNEDEFVEAINWCIEHPEKLDEIGSNARELIKSKYDNDLIISKLIKLFKEA